MITRSTSHTCFVNAGIFVLGLTAVACKSGSSNTEDSDPKPTAMEETGSSDSGSGDYGEPTGSAYELPIASDAIELEASVRVGPGGRVLLVDGDTYWIFSLDGTESGGTAEKVDEGSWSEYRGGLEFESEGESPEEVVDFAATSDAVGDIEEGRHFTRELDVPEGRACWRVTFTDDGWRAEEIDGSCLGEHRWLYSTEQTDTGYEFEFFDGATFAYAGDIGGLAMASQTWTLEFEQICQCALHPTQLYDVDRSNPAPPDDRRLVEDIRCECQGGQIALPAEGAQFVDFTENFDGSLAALVREPDNGIVLHVVRGQ